MLRIHASDPLMGHHHLNVCAQVCFWMWVVCKPCLQRLWHRCQASWNKDRNRTLKIALHSSAHAQWPGAPPRWCQVRMWPVLSPGEMNSVFSEVPRTLSQWNALASQAEGSFHFSVNLGGNPVGTGNGEERKCHVGLGAGRGFGLALL